MAPQNAGFPLSPAFNADRGQGASSPSGEIRLAVTFGTDSYSNRYINLVHEVGHLFGLPDLYPDSGGADSAKAGCWCIMSDIFHSVCFLGWHRHKNEWLDQPRKTYLQGTTSTWYRTLSPLSSRYGLSMIALPIDDIQKPSKVLVVELAQPVLGTNNHYWGDGVLIYTVDARIATGDSPVVVIPKQPAPAPTTVTFTRLRTKSMMSQTLRKETFPSWFPFSRNSVPPITLRLITRDNWPQDRRSRSRFHTQRTVKVVSSH